MNSILLPRWLARLFAILFYGQILGYVLCAGILLYLAAFGLPEGSKWTITANINGTVSAPVSMPETGKNLQQWSKPSFDLTNGPLNSLSLSRVSNSLYLSVRGPINLATLPMSLWLAGSTGLLLALLGIFTSYMFMKLFQSLADRHVFDEQQTTRLTRIGQGLLVFSVLNAGTKWFAEAGASGYLESYGFIVSEPSEQTYNLSVSAPSSDVMVALTGLCILALAQVFKYGTQLQQENELTI
ncbi:DUF2975 domain-containing protein [Fibrella forsythiae]|uniref:DUF2975 domain-containing protein n=1 Tax=Fibrella forsythiae TaxID=2817061 RepID=A0ABS3JU33_9BACT|nr:DUF2975 domain-containing protein [Fibrella forsythiae]MBO0952709.1 DUF2975 domain-containing protein [Fibrella forsythiae]